MNQHDSVYRLLYLWVRLAIHSIRPSHRYEVHAADLSVPDFNPHAVFIECTGCDKEWMVIP